MTDIRDTALRLSRAGLPIILLYGPAEGEPAQRGKKPRHNGWQTTKLTLAQVEANLPHHPGSNIGCVTGLMSGLVCVDIDPRNGGGSWMTTNLNRLMEGGAQVEQTGSGGYHLWFAHPGGWIRSRTGKHGIAPGVELLADGGHQAVIAPSIHHTGAAYVWQGTMDFADVRDFGAPLPAWIAAPEAPGSVAARSTTGGARATAETYTDHPADIEACRNRLAELEPAIEGAGGNAATFRAACFGRDHNLTPETFRELLDEWNQTCVPPWPVEQLQEMVRRGYRYAKASQPGQAAPSRAFTAVGTGAPEAPPLAPAVAAEQVADLTDWRERLVRNKDRTWKSHVRNVELVLVHDERLARCFRYNLFTNAVEVTRAPWRTWTDTAEWKDDDAVALASWVAANYPDHPALGTDVVHQAVRPFARRQGYHPVRDMLSGLTWDGRPRLGTWLVRYLGATDSDYVRAIGPRFLIGAVARVMQPGCKLDTMLILEGKQGLGKSTAVRVLFDPWYTDADLDPSNKDTSAIIRGHWGVEFGEMHGARRAEVTQLKAFLSRREDRQRDAYGRVPETHPRQSVFVGTTNSSDYLLDQTGGRRFWPVACGRIDLGKLTTDREQIWAEAYTQHQAGGADSAWWLTEAEEVHAAAEQAQRRTVDEAEDLIGGWLARGGDFGPVGSADGAAGKAVSALSQVTGLEVWTGALGGSAVTFNRAAQQRVADCMRALGWRSQVVRRSGQVIRCYVPLQGPLPRQEITL